MWPKKRQCLHKALVLGGVKILPQLQTQEQTIKGKETRAGWRWFYIQRGTVSNEDDG